jgi:hypothetical protein
MAVSSYVFVSYSRRDADFVSRLTDDLHRFGIQVWRDVEQISAGADWQEVIGQAVKGANVQLFVASSNSLSSEWIRHELAAFLSQAKPVIPIVLDEAGAASLPLELRQIQWVDFRGGYDQHKVKSLASSLLALGIPKQSRPIAPPGKKSEGYVFISYAEEDADFVAELKGFLAARNYAYWDYDESARNYHTQFFRELEGVIQEAVATLSVLSEAWKLSRWTIREYFFSEDAGIPVFLLRAKPLGPTLAIAGTPYIDFVGDRARGFEKLEKELRRKGL